MKVKTINFNKRGAYPEWRDPQSYHISAGIQLFLIKHGFTSKGNCKVSTEDYEKVLKTFAVSSVIKNTSLKKHFLKVNEIKIDGVKAKAEVICIDKTERYISANWRIFREYVLKEYKQN